MAYSWQAAIMAALLLIVPLRGEKVDLFKFILEKRMRGKMNYGWIKGSGSGNKIKNISILDKVSKLKIFKFLKLLLSCFHIFIQNVSSALLLCFDPC